MVIARTTGSLRRDGLLATLRKAVVHLSNRHATDIAFDNEFGTDTAGLIPLWEMKVESKNARYGSHYRATDEEDLVGALRSLGERFDDFYFVDLGCGKGRALLIAHRFGFRSVIGVEFADKLVEIARANAAKLGYSDVVVISADASGYEFPRGNMVVYLYNPFAGQILDKVVANLTSQRRESPESRIYVIYNQPVAHESLHRSDAFEFLGPVPGRKHVLVWRGARP